MEVLWMQLLLAMSVVLGVGLGLVITMLQAAKSLKECQLLCLVQLLQQL
jgi:flagellar biosynthesis protein FliQ